MDESAASCAFEVSSLDAYSRLPGEFVVEAPSPRKCANGALCGTGAKNCNLSLFLGSGLDGGGDGKLSIMSVVRNVSDGYAVALWSDGTVS